jgi:serine phosphatase RsbU (regulator of sigma subunit)
VKLRFRLIVAFFLLSVVPLAAVTLFSYASNARAMREAASREAELLAGELSQRMQVVTAQLSERVGHLMDVAEARAEASAAASKLSAVEAAKAAEAAAVVSAPTQQETQVAHALGEMAMLLNNIELRGLRGPRPPPPGAAPGAPPRPFTPGGRGRGDEGDRRGRGSPPPVPTGSSVAPPAPTDAAPPIAPTPPTPPVAGASPRPGRPSPNPEPPVDPNSAPRDRIMIDIGPMRRDIVRQFVPEGKWEQLSEQDRQRIMAEVNQRMLGIAQGIQMGAAEAQKRVAEAQREADEKAQAAAKAQAALQARPAPSPKPPTAPVVNRAPARRKVALRGNKLDVTLERDGQVVRAANVDVNLPNLLATVLTTTRRDRGEIPFAVGRDGRIYTQTEEDKRRIETLGVATSDPSPGAVRTGEWIVVSTADPTGSGLRFGIARPVGDSLQALRRTSARNAGLGLALIGLALVGIVPISGRLTRNLSTLSDGVRRIANGDYRARVNVTSKDEIGSLASAFNQMAQDVERHERAAVEQERIKRELELGRQIQHDMLPQSPLRLGLTEVKGVSVPAREVGGDFFNYFSLPDGRVALLVGDVSGKGVGAALLMANIQASLRTRLALGQDLAAIAREIDVDVEGNTPGPIYATLFVGILNPETRELGYVNAGHNPQYILRRGGTLEPMTSSGLPVGLLAGRGYAEARVQLSAGDLLFFYTDGCVEAENESLDMFGAERLERLLISSAAGAEDLLLRVEREIAAFRGTQEPFDDATMMVVKVG